MVGGIPGEKKGHVQVLSPLSINHINPHSHPSIYRGRGKGYRPEDL